MSESVLSFLVDSQADISVIKQSFIDKYILTDPSHIIKIKGITEESITSFGITQLEIFLPDLTLKHTIHVVPDTLAIPVSGILGKDFLKAFNCTIDYETMSLKINTKKTSIIFNMIKILS